MLGSISRLVVRAPKIVLSITLLFCGLAAIIGISAPAHLSTGGFVSARSQSAVADDVLTKEFDNWPTVTILVECPWGVENSAARRFGLELIARLRAVPDVTGLESIWNGAQGMASYLLSVDEKSALIIVNMGGSYNEQVASAITVNTIVHTVMRPAGITVKAGGSILTSLAISAQVSKDLATANAVTAPLLAVLMLWIFGSLVATLIPLAVAGIAFLGTLAMLRILAALTTVSVFALNLATALTLALAIDYSLLLVNRYREERAVGREHADSVIQTIQAAGRTVLYSATAVGLSLSVLLLFPLYALRSIGYAGIAVAALSAGASVIVTPALLALCGMRIDSLNVRNLLRRLFRRPAQDPKFTAIERTFWYRFAGAVIRHPVASGLLASEVVLVLAAPFLGVRFGLPDDRVLPETATVRQVGDAVRTQFETVANEITVVMPDRKQISIAQIGRYASALSRLHPVILVSSPLGKYQSGVLTAGEDSDPAMANAEAAYLLVYATGDPDSPAGRQVLAEIRGVRAPADVLLTGSAAEISDSLNTIASRLPLALGMIALLTFFVISIFSGSILLPLKAILLNAMSLCATFGAMVWIFQEGHFLGLLFGSTSSGFLIVEEPVLMFFVSFGVSMDYELFLLSRIREEWLSSARTRADNERAVQLGLARTARITTSAAALMTVVFVGLMTSEVTVIQMLGLGLALAVLMDVSLIRGVLAPAIMRLAGRANWWLPAPIKAYWEAHEVSEG
jgi:putative drug exporter of the RND superfamily